jgi:pimeloyl-ACP methyl ester carboxylesterase
MLAVEHPWHQMMTFVRRLRSASFALATLVLVACASPSHAPAMRFQAATDLSSGTSAVPAEVSSVFLRFPQNPAPGQSLRVLVALHGMGGDGESFARDLTAAADQHGWVLVAPTIAYGDYMNPVQVAQEDAVLVNWLSTYLAQLPNQTNQPIAPGALVLGFSRGAQLAHRFAEAFPERVAAVAAMSAGCYTLPQTAAADGTPLAFPFGVSDFPAIVGDVFDPTELQAVHFWVGVGNNDTNPADVPRQFDPYLGNDRLDRARAFVAALGSLNVSAQLVVFPGVPHALTPAMEGAAIAFLADSNSSAAGAGGGASAGRQS